MEKKRVLILGGGISGLAAAWYLSKDHDVALLEKGSRCGGLLQSARIFKVSRSGALLDLIRDVGLQDEIIYTSKEAHRRYLWMKGKMRNAQSVALPLLYTLLTEWRKPPSSKEETIYDFVARRFNRTVAARLFDPLTLGIYAGDCRKLSIESCFPTLKRWEEEHGSVLRGFLKERKGAPGLFSLRGGMQSLVDRLAANNCFCNQEVRAVRFKEEGVEVITNDGVWKGDLLYSALSAHEAGKLFQPLDAFVSETLLSIETASLQVMSVAYDAEVLDLNGFGYLVPTFECAPILGALFDSKIFPTEGTRLTVMLKAGKTVDDGLECLRAHLNISAEPSTIQLYEAKNAIPQYTLGHKEKIASLQAHLQAHFPRCRLLGNYLNGVSVNDCIQNAKNI
jgi:oxygen-dependent protoporphyrinogen oxidase